MSWDPWYMVLKLQVWNFWNEDNITTMIDTRISSMDYRAEVMRCIHIGLLCVQQFARDRPSISMVLSMLNSEITELPNPKLPAFAIKTVPSEAGTSSSQLSNTITITTVEGRWYHLFTALEYIMELKAIICLQFSSYLLNRGFILLRNCTVSMMPPRSRVVV